MTVILDITRRRRRPLVVDPRSSAARWTPSPATSTRPGSRPPKARASIRGQCAELCGRNHANMYGARRSRMPIDEYKAWYDRKAGDIKTAKTRRRSAAQRPQQREQRPGRRQTPRTDGQPRPTPHGRTDYAPPPAPADHRATRSRPRPSAAGRRGSPRPTTRRSGSCTSWTVARVLRARRRRGAADPHAARRAGQHAATPEKYNQIFTMHGTTMIFLVVVPVWAGFANYLLPLMIGARDVAFPRLNAWSYWMFLFGGLALYASVFFTPPEAGWFSYVPLSLEAVLAHRRPGRVDLHGPPHRPLARCSAPSTSSPRSTTCARPAWAGAACRCSCGRS